MRTVPKRLRATLVVTMLGAGCAPAPRCPPPPPPCLAAAPGPLEAMLDQPVELELSILDGLNPAVSCAGVPPHVIRVKIDQHPWCEVSIDCDTTVIAPPPSYACEGPKLEPGEHTVGVEIVGRPASLMLRTMSLPAFRKVGRSELVAGAYVSVWVRDDIIIIDPPTAMGEMRM